MTMLVRQFFVSGLGHASYLIADESAGEAAVFDPKRDVEDYLAAAREEGVRITHVCETHLHNDFVSGAGELARRTGAAHHVPAAASAAFPHSPVREGDEIHLGQVSFRVIETPGHTPEHVCYAVTDHSRADVPVALLTGGDLLVGTVGRPDLLGPEMARTLAPALYHSLREKILAHDDYVEVYPTHGAGSLCGRGITAKRTTTIGYERRFNPAVRPETEEAFVAQVLSGDPTIPAYYARMRPLNQAGPEPLPGGMDQRPLPPQQVAHALEHGALLLDLREPAAFAGAHVPGAVGIPLDPRFGTWAGSLLTPDTQLILLLGGAGDYAEATAQLRRIGFPDPYGYLLGGIEGWAAVGLPIETLTAASAAELRARLAGDAPPTVLDVRTQSEWDEGHVPGAAHIPLSELPDRLAEVPSGRLAVICGSGHRSIIAASLLARAGHEAVVSVLGGMDAWRATEAPLERPLAQKEDDGHHQPDDGHIPAHVPLGDATGD